MATLADLSLDELSIDTLRLLAVDEVEKAKSGHPGAPLGCAPIAYLLFHKVMKHNPANSKWVDRDRFVLSNGHASALLYATLFLSGYEVTIEDLQAFRQWHSRTPGHPEYGDTDGVEATTGPLGQGLAMAVGMAIAEKHLAAIYNKPGYEIVNHHTYVLCGDGDLMEGISHEACALAGTLGLGKLILFYDDNLISLDGPTELSYNDNVLERFEAYHWHTQRAARRQRSERRCEADHLEAAVGRVQASFLLSLAGYLHGRSGYGNARSAGANKLHGVTLWASRLRRRREKFYGFPEDPELLRPRGRAEELAQGDRSWRDD